MHYFVIIFLHCRSSTDIVLLGLPGCITLSLFPYFIEHPGISYNWVYLDAFLCLSVFSLLYRPIIGSSRVHYFVIIFLRYRSLPISYYWVYQGVLSSMKVKVVGWYFPFHSNFNRANGDPDQTPRFAVSDLGLHCLNMSHKLKRCYMPLLVMALVRSISACLIP